MKGIVYGGLLSVVFVLSGCSGSQKEGRDSKEIPVEIVKVAKTVPADTRNYVGTVEEVVSSSISFQVMGNVERVLVGEGQKVREGQLLAVLDKATLENAYNASAASLRQAEDAYARMRTLHENKSLPDMKWVEVESKLEQARSMERISRKNLEDRNLYAPFGGVIGKRMVEAGERAARATGFLLVKDRDGKREDRRPGERGRHARRSSRHDKGSRSGRTMF